VRRLPAVSGEWIDRGAPLEFSFERRRVAAFRGDTISSALAASGITVIGRSFKYHRPRGLLSLADHDVNGMVQVQRDARSVPNVRADVTPVESGWQVAAVNTRGGLAHDRLAVLDRLSRFLPVGFYYKAFHGKRLAPHWERMFRGLTGLGAVDLESPRRTSPKRYEFCDVLVIGAGPAGLASAIESAARGADVLLVDENPAPGGSGGYALGGDARIAAETAALVRAAHADSRIRLLTSSFAAGYYADHWVAVVTPQAMAKVRARAVILAQGAYEQPAVFRGNDLPGVLLASAAQRLLYRFAVAPAQRVVVLTANAEGYAAAQDALALGIEVAAVLDLRAAPGLRSRAAAAALRDTGVRIVCGVKPLEAIAGAGGRVARFEFVAGTGGQRDSIELDGLWMSVGFAPANAFLHQAGGSVRYDRAIEQFVPDVLPAGVYACGKIAGAYPFDARLSDGRRAGAQAAFGLGLGAEPPAAAGSSSDESPSHAYPVFPHPKGKEFVDFDEDLQIADIVNACQEGFDSSELLKRFSTLGMGPSQGKHSNLNGLRILARVRGEGIEQHALTTARPMFHPVPMFQLAGRGFSPERRTPLDADHEASGAVWMPAGNWRRPEYYSVPGLTREQAIAAEVRAVRNAVGLIDVGTLGKIEAHGAQAGEFLERVYAARFSNLKPGATRYGLMLDEAGVIIDDGVIGRSGPEAFYFTTTTANSATLFRELGRLATWWGMPVGLVNLTGHYAAINLAGPLARAVLQGLTDIDLCDGSFPYLGLRDGQVAGVPCRLMRVGFVGELGYEIHLPAEHAPHLWHALLAAGAPQGIRPFGVEAQRMLRLEKGHLIVGQDTDGVTNALEINAPWAIKTDKPFFIGQRSLAVLAKRPRRQTLIGFRLPPGATQRPRECHLVIDGGEIAGRVTSVGLSPTLGHVIGLALVTPAVATRGRFQIRIDGGVEIVAEAAQLPFYDPTGSRQMSEEAAVAPAKSSALMTSGTPLRLARAVPAGRAVTLSDVSWRRRFGIKGPAAQAWLEARGYSVPGPSNSWAIADDILVGRLATSEFLVEALGTSQARVAAAAGELAAAGRPPGVFPVARQDLVVSLGGDALADLLAQVCSVDFRMPLGAARGASGPLLLTSMIGVAVVAVPRLEDGRPGLTVWSDPSFANYFWSTLIGVAADLGGGVLLDDPIVH
jgi:sarcosine oxidase subunit alpha